MTAVLNYVILVLIGLSALAAVFFVIRGVLSRSQFAREAYGVGQVEARRSMKVDIVRGVGFVVLTLILLGVYGLSARLAKPMPEPTTVPLPTPLPASPESAATDLPAATASPEQTPTTKPTDPPATAPVTNTATPPPEPTATPTAAPKTAVVTSEVGVWLRGAPGVEGEQLEWVLGGTELILLPGEETADDFQWRQVRAPSGNEGWVAADYIAINE